MTPEPYDAGWMPGETYDRLRAEDFAKLCAAASLDHNAHVPTCPEWDVRALCDHLARVYQARAFTIEHSTPKSSDDFELLASDADPIAWVRTWSDTLNDALSRHDDGDPTISFLPEANT
ncbi:MAG TPA: maleylpyruvate isomerase N-terminal domain-containing protein, partial [Acidimicrobiales bacterium]